MYEIFNNIIGMDLSQFDINDNLLYVCTFISVIFVIGEIFNIIRHIFVHIFGD